MGETRAGNLSGGQGPARKWRLMVRVEVVRTDCIAVKSMRARCIVNDPELQLNLIGLTINLNIVFQINNNSRMALIHTHQSVTLLPTLILE